MIHAEIARFIITGEGGPAPFLLSEYYARRENLVKFFPCFLYPWNCSLSNEHFLQSNFCQDPRGTFIVQYLDVVPPPLE
jgi:hypothetical protein